MSSRALHFDDQFSTRVPPPSQGVPHGGPQRPRDGVYSSSAQRNHVTGEMDNERALQDWIDGTAVEHNMQSFGGLAGGTNPMEVVQSPFPIKRNHTTCEMKEKRVSWSDNQPEGELVLPIRSLSKNMIRDEFRSRKENGGVICDSMPDLRRRDAPNGSLSRLPQQEEYGLPETSPSGRVEHGAILERLHDLVKLMSKYTADSHHVDSDERSRGLGGSKRNIPMGTSYSPPIGRTGSYPPNSSDTLPMVSRDYESDEWRRNERTETAFCEGDIPAAHGFDTPGDQYFNREISPILKTEYRASTSRCNESPQIESDGLRDGQYATWQGNNLNSEDKLCRSKYPSQNVIDRSRPVDYEPVSGNEFNDDSVDQSFDDFSILGDTGFSPFSLDGNSEMGNQFRSLGECIDMKTRNQNIQGIQTTRGSPSSVNEMWPTNNHQPEPPHKEVQEKFLEARPWLSYNQRSGERPSNHVELGETSPVRPKQNYQPEFHPNGPAKQNLGVFSFDNKDLQAVSRGYSRENAGQFDASSAKFPNVGDIFGTPGVASLRSTTANLSDDHSQARSRTHREACVPQTKVATKSKKGMLNIFTSEVFGDSTVASQRSSSQTPMSGYPTNYSESPCDISMISDILGDGDETKRNDRSAYQNRFNIESGHQEGSSRFNQPKIPGNHHSLRNRNMEARDSFSGGIAQMQVAAASLIQPHPQPSTQARKFVARFYLGSSCEPQLMTSIIIGPKGQNVRAIRAAAAHDASGVKIRLIGRGVKGREFCDKGCPLPLSLCLSCSTYNAFCVCFSLITELLRYAYASEAMEVGRDRPLTYEVGTDVLYH